MLIYDKKENSIDIYSIEAKREELKRYRKRVLKKYRDEQLFYGLRTNFENTIQTFTTTNDVNIRLLNYDDITPCNNGYYSQLAPMDSLGYYNEEEQKLILEKYINGEYDNLTPIKVYEPGLKERADRELYRFLKTEPTKLIGKNSRGALYEIKNMINLPRNLYLLHLLQNGYFAKLTQENIRRQLELFTIDYQRSIKISDIEDIISTGLVRGTIEQAIQKAKIGTAILKKVKK